MVCRAERLVLIVSGQEKSRFIFHGYCGRPRSIGFNGLWNSHVKFRRLASSPDHRRPRLCSGVAGPLVVILYYRSGRLQSVAGCSSPLAGRWFDRSAPALGDLQPSGYVRVIG